MKSSCSLDVYISCREYGYFSLESLIAIAFGRYVNLQRGESDKLTEDANKIMSTTREDEKIPGGVLLAGLCRFFIDDYNIVFS